MSLIVEDGSGIANADSYLSLIDARALSASYGLEIDADDTMAEVQLRQGYQGLLVSEKSLQGRRTHDIQTGPFPRRKMYSNCVLVGENEIPLAVKLAQLNYSAAINGGYGTNSINTGQELSGFSVGKGAYSETYQDNKTKTNATIQGVDNALYPLTIAGYANSPCGRKAGFGGLTREEFF